MARSSFPTSPHTRVVWGARRWSAITQGTAITGGLRDRVIVNNPQVVIDWTPNDDATGGGPITILRAGNELQFQNNGDIGVGQYTVLNRVIPDDPSRAIQFDGHVISQLDTGYGATRAAISGSIRPAASSPARPAASTSAAWC